MDSEKIFANNEANKGLFSKICKQPMQLKNKQKQNIVNQL